MISTKFTSLSPHLSGKRYERKIIYAYIAIAPINTSLWSESGHLFRKLRDMGIICDPPTFTGGQMANIDYVVQCSSLSEDGNTYYWIRFYSDPASAPLGRLTPYSDAFMRSLGSSGISAPIKGNWTVEWCGTMMDAVPVGDDGGFNGGAWWYLDGNTMNYVSFQSPSHPPNLQLKKGTKPKIYKVLRIDGQPDTGGNPQPTNCRCDRNSCRIECASSPYGFCCIDRQKSDRLLRLIRG